jgi:hypothetical protein
MSVRCCQDFFNDLSTSITGPAAPPASIPSSDATVAIAADHKTHDSKKKEKGKKYFISGYNIFHYDIKDGLREEVDQKVRLETQGQTLDHVAMNSKRLSYSSKILAEKWTNVPQEIKDIYQKLSRAIAIEQSRLTSNGNPILLSLTSA